MFGIFAISLAKYDENFAKINQFMVFGETLAETEFIFIKPNEIFFGWPI